MDRTDTITEMLNDNRDFLVGGLRFEAVLAEWVALDMEPSTMLEYAEAGCFTADAVFNLDGIGVTPAQAATKTANGETIGYSLANGDMSTADAAAHLYA